MSYSVVFSQFLSPDQPNLSARFSDATGFYVNVPFEDVELEIDCFLQVYLNKENIEKVRVHHLGTIDNIKNIIDTETIFTIPLEYQNTGVEMALLFVPSQQTTLYLEAIIVKQNVDLNVILDLLGTTNLKLNLLLESLNVPVPLSNDTANYKLLNII